MAMTLAVAGSPSLTPVLMIGGPASNPSVHQASPLRTPFRCDGLTGGQIN